MADLQIKLSASLNRGKSIEEINNQIKAIEKSSSLQKLKLKIDIDNNFTKQIDNFIKSVDRIKRISDEQNRVIREEIEIYKKLDGQVEEVRKQFLKNGEVVERTKKIHDQNKKSLANEAEATEKLSKSIKELNKDQLDSIKISKNKSDKTTGVTYKQTEGFTTTQTRAEADGTTLVGKTITTDYKKAREENQKLKQGVVELRAELTKLAQVGVLSKTQLGEAAKAVNSAGDLQQLESARNKYVQLLATQRELLNVEQAKYKVSKNEAQRKQQIEETNKKLQEQLRLYQQQANINLENSKAIFGRNIDTKALETYLDKVKRLTSDTPNLANEMKNLDLELRQIQAHARTASREVSFFGTTLKNAFKFANWVGISTVFFSTITAVKDLARNIKLIDDQMTELARVSDAFNLSESLSQSALIADDLGQKITDVNKALISASRLGVEGDDLFGLTRQAVLLSSISDLSADEALTNLNSIVTQFGYSMDKVAEISDKLNSVDNETVASTTDLIQSLSKAGGVMDTFGVSMENGLGYTVALKEALGNVSGNEIGTALKSVISRITTMDKVVEGLENVGVRVFDPLTGEVLRVDEILKNTADRWNTFSSATQQSLSVLIAGRNHVSKFASLMSNFAAVQKTSTILMDSEGSSALENLKAQQALSSQMAKLSNSWVNFSVTVGESGLKDFFSTVIKGATNFMNSMTALTEVTNGWNLKLPLLTAGLYGVAKALGVLGVSIKGVRASLGWISALTVGIELLISSFASAKSISGESTAAMIENAQALSNKADQIDKLVAKYQALRPEAEKSTVVQGQLTDVMKDLQKIAPELTGSLREQGDAFKLNTDDAAKYAEQLRGMGKELLAATQVSLQVEISDSQNELDEAKGKLDDYAQDYESHQKRLTELQEKYGLERTKDQQEAIANIEDAIKKSVSESLENDNYESSMSELIDFKHLKEQLFNSDYMQQMLKINELEGNTKSLRDRFQAITDMLNGTEQATKATSNLSGMIDEETGEIIQNTDVISVNAEARSEFNTETNESASAIESLASSYDTLHEGETLSLSTLLNLIETYPEVASYIAQTNDLTLQKGEILKVVGEAQRKLRIEEIDGEIQSLTTLQQSLEAKRIMYKQFYEQVGQFMGLSLDIPNVNTGFQDPLNADEKEAYEANKKRLEELSAMRIALDKPIELLFEQATSSKSSKPKTETNKDAPTEIATIEALINGINAQAEAQAKLNEVTSATVDKLESEKNYAEAIKETNELLKGQQSELIKLNAANISLDSKRTDLQNANSSYDMQSWVDANGEQTTAYVNLYNSLGSKSAQDSLQALFDKWQALTQAIRDNREQMTSVKEALEETRLKGTKSYFELRTQELAKFDEQLEQSEKAQSRYKEGSSEYAAEEQKQIKLLADKRLALQNENNWIRKRLEANDKAKTAEKLTAEQVAFLTEKLKENSDAWYEVDTAQRSAIETLRNDYIEQAKEQISSLVESIKSSLNQEDIFNVDEFNNSVDAIYTSLEQIEGKFNYIASNESTRSVRNDIMNYANEIINIANEVSNFAQSSTTDVTELGNQINKQVAYVAELKGKLAGINQLIRERELQYSQEEAALENNIKVIEQVYDTQIKAQQKKLDLLDEEYEKEDRIRALKEINDEIDKTKADKRFSYITETGEEILTYDKARVDELEKQKDELVEQYEREDVRNAIDDEIERLQDAKDRQTQILQTQLDSMRSIHQQEINTLQLYQTNLSSLLSSLQTDTESKLTSFETVMSEGLENGTVAAQTGTQALQGVIDGWMSSSLTKWDSHISSVQSKLSALQSLYAQLATLASTSATSTTTTKTTTSTTSTKSVTPVKYHTTGKVGEPPLKPNEVPTVLEVGEWVLKPEQIKSFKSNIVSSTLGQLMNSVRDIGKSALSSIVNKTTSVTQSPVYSFGDITVQANNPMEFMDGLRTHINSIRK